MPKQKLESIEKIINQDPMKSQQRLDAAAPREARSYAVDTNLFPGRPEHTGCVGTDTA